MRSCLIQLLMTVAVIFALVWFGLPFGASWLATTALNSAGFTGTDTKVEVSANLPPRILLGHADKIHLTSTQVGVGDLHAGSIDLTLGNVEFIDRKIGTVTGTLTAVRVPAPSGDPITIDTATVEGPGTAATATLTTSSAGMAQLAEAQFYAATRITSTVRLAAPNKVTVTAGGKSEPGRLVVSGGAITLVPSNTSLPTVLLIQPGPGNPFNFTSVTVGGTTVTLVGTINLQSLLGL
jgi:hypothetical protein